MDADDKAPSVRHLTVVLLEEDFRTMQETAKSHNMTTAKACADVIHCVAYTRRRSGLSAHLPMTVEAVPLRPVREFPK